MVVFLTFFNKYLLISNNSSIQLKHLPDIGSSVVLKEISVESRVFSKNSAPICTFCDSEAYSVPKYQNSLCVLCVSLKKIAE